jgi:hypothetical protein
VGAGADEARPPPLSASDLMLLLNLDKSFLPRTFPASIRSIYIHGDAYLAAGQGDAAATEFQKLLDHSGILWNCWTGALAYLGLARANALKANTSRDANADAARVSGIRLIRIFSISRKMPILISRFLRKPKASIRSSELTSLGAPPVLWNNLTDQFSRMRLAFVEVEARIAQDIQAHPAGLRVHLA